jgi:hypothetical protein
MSGSEYFDWSYAAEKFAQSADTLGRSFGPNWQRMAMAIEPLERLREQDFPDHELYVRTRKVVEAASKRGPYLINGKPYWGSREHTLRRSRRRTLERLAHEILSINEQIKLRRGGVPN